MGHLLWFSALLGAIGIVASEVIDAGDQLPPNLPLDPTVYVALAVVRVQFCKAS